MDLGITLIGIGVLLAIVAVVLSRRTAAVKREIEAEKSEQVTPDLGRPRPPVAEFHVRGDEAHVRFDVPLPQGDVDEVMTDLLVSEAVEVVREKRHHLPIDDVTRVVVFAGRGGDPVKVGDLELESAGTLPPPDLDVPAVRLGNLGPDPLELSFSAGLPEQAPDVVAPTTDEGLAFVAKELRIPRPLDVGLRSIGIEPADSNCGALVRGLLQLYGYKLVPKEEHSYLATKAGSATLVKEVPHQPGDHPELEDEDIRRFVVEFLQSKTDRGLLVTEKFGPFQVYERERNEPRVQFLTRERMQAFIDSMALG